MAKILAPHIAQNGGRPNKTVIRITEMEVHEQKKLKKQLIIYYSYLETLFGKMLVANTRRGICYMGFADKDLKVIKELKNRFPKAVLKQELTQKQKDAIQIFLRDWKCIPKIQLHIKGTDFQLKVWKELIKIPLGKVTTYGEIATKIGHPKASRAVGTAVGKNPVVYLIPCHRVICANGGLGGFFWNLQRKIDFLNCEAVGNKKSVSSKSWQPTFF